MIDLLRTVRRPAPGFAWRALALHVGPALLLAATVLPTLLLMGRLPRYEVPPYQDHPLNYPIAASVFGASLVAGWVIVLAIATTSRPPRPQLWERWLPMLYGLGALTVALTLPAVLLNLDRPYGLPPDAGGPLRLPLAYAAIAACSGVGLVLGRRAAATEPSPRPAARAIWIAQVDADRSWWLLWLAAAAAWLIVAVPFAVTGAWPAALQTYATLLGVSVAIAAWGSRGQVSISPSGVRVRSGRLPVFGWQLGIDQIASVEVARGRVLRLVFSGFSHLALRDGPALLIRTRSGERRWVTVPEAEDAAAVLGGWLEERRAALAAAHEEETS